MWGVGGGVVGAVVAGTGSCSRARKKTTSPHGHTRASDHPLSERAKWRRSERSEPGRRSGWLVLDGLTSRTDRTGEEEGSGVVWEVGVQVGERMAVFCPEMALGAFVRCGGV